MRVNLVAALPAALAILVAGGGCGARSDLLDDATRSGARLPSASSCPGWQSEVERVGGAMWESPTDVAETDEGDVIVVGHTAVIDYPSFNWWQNRLVDNGIFVTRLGCHSWEQRRGEPNDVSAVSAAAGIDGTVLVAINAHGDAMYPTLAELWAIDEAGSERYAISIPNALVVRATPSPRGGFYVAGDFAGTLEIGGAAFGDAPQGKQGIFVLELDAQGQPIWAQTAAGAMLTNDPPYQVNKDVVALFDDPDEGLELLSRHQLAWVRADDGFHSTNSLFTTDLDRAAPLGHGAYVATIPREEKSVAIIGANADGSHRFYEQLSTTMTAFTASVAPSKDGFVVAATYYRTTEGGAGNDSRGGTFVVSYDAAGHEKTRAHFEDTDKLPPYDLDADGPGLGHGPAGVVLAAGFRRTIDVDGTVLSSAGEEDVFVARLEP